MTSEIGKKIKRIREKNNLSQRRFGQKVGLSSKTISAYETGRITPTYKVLEDISRVYDVNIYGIPDNKKDKIIENINRVKSYIKEIEEILNLKG